MNIELMCAEEGRYNIIVIFIGMKQANIQGEIDIGKSSSKTQSI